MAPFTRRMSNEPKSTDSGTRSTATPPLTPSPPRLMKDVGNYGRELPSRLTRNPAPVYQEADSGKLNKNRSKNIKKRPASSTKNSRANILSASRKQIILEHLKGVLANSANYGGFASEPNGMTMLKDEILIKLRRTKCSQLITISDVDRWLKNKSFKLLITSLMKTKAQNHQEGQPQPGPSSKVKTSNKSNSSQGQARKPPRRVAAQRKLSPVESSSSTDEFIVTRRQRKHTVSPTPPEATSVTENSVRGNNKNNNQNAAVIHTVISSDTSSSPQGLDNEFPQFYTEVGNTKMVKNERLGVVVINPPQQPDPLECLPETDDANANPVEEENEEEMDLGNIPVGTGDSNQQQTQASRQLHDFEKNRMLQFFDEVHGHVNSLQDSYTNLMANGRGTHVSLQVFSHQLQSMSGFVENYMDPEMDSGFYERPVFY